MKCPMRNDAMGNMPECDPECAWLVGVQNSQLKWVKVCAATVKPGQAIKNHNNMGYAKEDE